MDHKILGVQLDQIHGVPLDLQILIWMDGIKVLVQMIGSLNKVMELVMDQVMVLDSELVMEQVMVLVMDQDLVLVLDWEWDLDLELVMDHPTYKNTQSTKEHGPPQPKEILGGTLSQQQETD